MIGIGIYVAGLITTIVYGFWMFSGYKPKNITIWIEIGGVLVLASLLSWLGFIAVYSAKKTADKL